MRAERSGRVAGSAWHVVLALAVASCAPAQQMPARAPTDGRSSSSAITELERFFPLVHDNVLTYAAWLAASNEPERLILQVERRSPERGSLRSGNSIKRVEFVPDGVRLVSGGYLLQAPLEAGRSWAGPAGRVVVSAVDRTVTVRAGQFTGCVETTETARGGGSRVISTTYCPDVGMVTLRVDDGEHEERFELESFGPRVDVNAL